MEEYRHFNIFKVSSNCICYTALPIQKKDHNISFGFNHNTLDLNSNAGARGMSSLKAAPNICSNRYSWFNLQTKWASSWENLSFGACEQYRRRPAWASVQSDQRLCYSLFGKYISRLATLFSLCSWAGWFESHYAGNPEDGSSHDEAQIRLDISCESLSSLISIFRKPREISQNLLSAEVVIDTFTLSPPITTFVICSFNVQEQF